MRIRLWKGHHSAELPGLLKQAWEGEGLLILCPPSIRNFDFLGTLSGSVETVGDWDSSLASIAASAKVGGADPRFSSAVLGVFTSGTASGSARLVLYSRRNLEASLQGIREFFDVSRISSIFCYPQPFHTFGLALGYMHSLIEGLELVNLSGPYARDFHRLWLESVDSKTLTLGTPTHFHDLVSWVREKGVKPRDSYSCVVGGARVSVSLWDSMRDMLRIQMPSIGYGATEASPGITHHPPGRRPLEEGEIGVPLSNLSLRLRPGEGVEFEGDGVCLAVVQDGEAKFPRSILIRDELEKRVDGMWVYRGRNELLLNRGGHKFSLEAIEEKVRTELGFSSVCLGVSDPRLGEDLGVLLQLAESTESPDSSDKLRAEESVARVLRESFGIKLNPANVRTISALPTNGSMKVDRAHTARLFEGPR